MIEEVKLHSQMVFEYPQGQKKNKMTKNLREENW